jgi:hypothetical protein
VHPIPLVYVPRSAGNTSTWVVAVSIGATFSMTTTESVVAAEPPHPDAITNAPRVAAIINALFND